MNSDNYLQSSRSIDMDQFSNSINNVGNLQAYAGAQMAQGLDTPKPISAVFGAAAAAKAEMEEVQKLVHELSRRLAPVMRGATPKAESAQKEAQALTASPVRDIIESMSKFNRGTRSILIDIIERLEI